jgi:hypothetical protein
LPNRTHYGRTRYGRTHYGTSFRGDTLLTVTGGGRFNVALVRTELHDVGQPSSTRLQNLNLKSRTTDG